MNRTLRNAAAGMFCLLSLSACDAERSPMSPTDPSPAPKPGASEHVLAELVCTVDIPSDRASCESPRRAGAGAAADVQLGTVHLRIHSRNRSYDSIAQVYSVEYAIENMLQEPVGTLDRTTVSGLKMVLTSPPVPVYYIAGDTGSVSLRNPDGTGTFNGPNQPYKSYPEIVQPSDTSAWKIWEFNMSRTVQTFQARVWVWAPIPSENSVPAVAPDSLPSWLYAPQSIESNDPELGGMFVRNVVRILFKEETSQGWRAAAVAKVGGEVVGGTRLLGSDGIYMVRLLQDTTAGSVVRAIAKLDSLSATVEASSPEMVYERQTQAARVGPNDGPGWESSAWRESPDLASGDNWALEAIAAPRAWGCTTGSPSTGVAVVDDNYNSLADLSDGQSSNVVFNNGVTVADTAFGHGSAVASVLAAQGNNSSKMTGVMWHAGLRLYDMRVRPPGAGPNLVALSVIGASVFEANLAAAILSGAPVVNISRAMRYGPESAPRLPTNAEYLGTMYAVSFTQKVIYRLGLLGKKPLLVISSGNSAFEAKYAGLPLLNLYFPDRVLVVGAHTRRPYGPAAFSNYGTLVDLMAPGVDVSALDGHGNIVHASGTSFAAPVVSGIAGLLFSFDPRLTAPEVKQLILDGALAGGRSVAGGAGSSKYLAHAYESLKLAAQRPGAPVCGNPMWLDSATARVLVKRGAQWKGAEEALFTWPGTGLVAWHHGKTVQMGTAAFRWTNGSWSVLSNPATPLQDAVGYSQAGKSHWGDSTVTVQKVPVTGNGSGFEQFKISVNGTSITTVDGPRVRNPLRLRTCVAWPVSGDQFSNCQEYANTWGDLVTSTHTVAFSPSGDEVILAVARDSSAYIAEPADLFGTTWYRNHGETATTIGTHVYHVNIHTGLIVRQWFHSLSRIEAIGVGEDGSVMKLRRRRLFFSQTHTVDGSFPAAKFNHCDVAYVTGSGAQIFSLPLVPRAVYSDRTPCHSESTIAS